MSHTGRALARLSMVGAFTGTSLVNYGFGLAAGWFLQPGDFGLLAFAQTLLLICGLILNSGFAWSLTRSLASLAPSRHSALTRGAIVQNLGLAIVLSAALAAMFVLGPLHAGLEDLRVLLIVVSTLPFIALVASVSAAAQGLGRFSAAALLQLIEVVGKAAVGLALVHLGFGIVGAVAGFLIGAILAAGVGIWLLTRVFGISLRGNLEYLPVRDTSGLFGALLAQAILLNQDVLAMKLYSGNNRALTGEYQAGIVLANAPFYLAAALLPLLFTELAGLQDKGNAHRIVGGWLGMTLLLLLPMEMVLILAPNWAIQEVFPHAYRSGASALRLLALGNCVVIPCAALSTVFQAIGLAAVPARIVLVVVVCEAVALRIAVPLWQGQGAATLFLVAGTSALLGLGITYAKKVDIRCRWRALRWLARYFLALVAGTCAFDLATHSGVNIAVALTIGAVVYAIFVRMLRLATMELPHRRHGRYRPQVVLQD